MSVYGAKHKQGLISNWPRAKTSPIVNEEDDIVDKCDFREKTGLNIY